MHSVTGPISPAIQAEIIQSLAVKLRAYYVFPAVAEEICAALQTRLADGEYADIAEGELFALALTMHMQEVHHDEHLWVRFHPRPLPDQEDALRQDPAWRAAQHAKALLDNFGLHRAERLPGNVGCLDIHYFHRPAWGGATAFAAMNFLADTGALIIDLRRCEGGYPGMIALVASYLFGEEPIHLSSIYWRAEDATQQYWTLPYVPGPRLIDQPVYILTSRVTFSGGEEFARILQERKRAAIIGEKTDGGAHPGASYRLGPHFEAFIPIGRAISPVTGGDWEGTGVTPDIIVPQEQAFAAAYRLALEAILAGLEDAPAGPNSELVEEIHRALND